MKMTREALEGFLKGVGPVGLLPSMADKIAAERADQFLALFGEPDFGYEATFTDTGESYEREWGFETREHAVAYCEEQNREEDHHCAPGSKEADLHCTYTPKGRIKVKAEIEIEVES